MGTQAELLVSDLLRNIDRVQKDRDRNRFAAAGVRLAATVLSVLITIMLGVKGLVPSSASDVISVAALFGSSALTGLSGWESFADYGGRWIRKKTTLGDLLNLRDDINFALAGDGQLTEPQLREYRERYNRYIGEEHRLWVNERSKSISSPIAGGSGR
jgi:hypothetical protein